MASDSVVFSFSYELFKCSWKAAFGVTAYYSKCTLGPFHIHTGLESCLKSVCSGTLFLFHATLQIDPAVLLGMPTEGHPRYICSLPSGTRQVWFLLQNLAALSLDALRQLQTQVPLQFLGPCECRLSSGWQGNKPDGSRRPQPTTSKSRASLFSFLGILKRQGSGERPFNFPHLLSLTHPRP